MVSPLRKANYTENCERTKNGRLTAAEKQVFPELIKTIIFLLREKNWSFHRHRNHSRYFFQCFFRRQVKQGPENIDRRNERGEIIKESSKEKRKT